MTLDRTPFIQGLDQAKADVERFEREDHRVTEHVDLAGLEEAKAELERLHAEQADRVRVNVDDQHAKAELERLRLELARLGHEHETATVNVNTRSAEANVRQLTGSVTRLGAVASVIGRTAMPAMIAGLVGLTPALVPLGTVGAGAILGMGAAFGTAGLAAAVFGAAAKSQLKEIEAAANKTGKAQQDALAKLGPGGQQAATALKQLEQSWAGLQQATRPYVTQLITIGAQTLNSLMPALRGLATTAGGAFMTLAAHAKAALQGPFWQQFLGFVQQQARPAILAFGGSFGNVAHGMASLTMAFQPLEARFLQGMGHMTGAFQQWASTLANSPGFHNFLAAVQRDIPVVMGFLKALGGAAIQLIKALEPVGRTILQGLTPVFQQLGRDMPAIGQGFAALGRFAVVLLRNIEPLLPLLARLLVALEPIATVLVNALGTAIRALAGPLTVMIQALTPAAQVLFPALARVIQGLAPIISQLFRGLGPLVTLLARMAAAILPGLVPVTGALVRGFLQLLGALRPLQGPLIQLAVSFGRLLAAVAPTIAQMINATAPFVRLLADGLAPIVRLVANLLSSSFVQSMIKVTLMLNPLTAGIELVRLAFNGIKAVVGLVAPFVSSAWQASVTAVTAVWHTLESVGKTVFGAIEWAVKHLTPVGWLISNWHAVSSAVTAVWRGIESAANAVWSGIQWAIMHLTPIGWLISNWNHVSSALTGLWHGIEGAASAAWGFIKDAIVNPIRDALSWLGSIFSTLFNIGKNIVQSLVNGVSSMGQWLIDKLVGIVKDAFNGVLQFLGISSPSRLYHGVGVSMVEGLANGILAAGPQVHRALGRVLGGMGTPTLTAGVTATAVPAVAGGVGGGPLTATVTQHFYGDIHAGNPSDMRKIQVAAANGIRQVTRARGGRGG